jgi:hypothetical protein
MKTDVARKLAQGVSKPWITPLQRFHSVDIGRRHRVMTPGYGILRFTSSKKFRSTVTWTEPFPPPASSGV